MFRPEVKKWNINQPNPYKYNWEALEEWVAECQYDNSLISKLRLQAFHTRAIRNCVTNQNKVNAAEYRARNRTLWEHKTGTEYRFGSSSHDQNVELAGLIKQTDIEFEQDHSLLSTQTTNNIKKHLQDNEKQASTFLTTYKKEMNQTSKRKHSNMCSHSPKIVLNRKNSNRNNSVHQEHDCKKNDNEITEIGNKLHNLDNDPKMKLFFSTSNEDYINRNNKHQKNNSLILNKEQKEIVDLYDNYFTNLGDSNQSPPQVVLLTGQAGTGKSTVINQVNLAAQRSGQSVLKLAYNNTNAIDNNGPTLFSFCFLSKCNCAKEFKQLNIQDIEELITTYNVQWISLIIIDEISNVPIYVLARLSQIFSQIKENYNMHFGGLPILLVGDLGQKGPVKNVLMTTKLLNHVNKCKDSAEKAKRYEIRTGEKSQANATELESSVSLVKLRKVSPVDIGCEILLLAKWFELIEQKRCEDEDHIKLLNQMNKGEKIDFQSVVNIKTFTRENIEDSSVAWKDNGWHTAPVIVATNRERLTLNAIRCKLFAKLKRNSCNSLES